MHDCFCNVLGLLNSLLHELIFQILTVADAQVRNWGCVVGLRQGGHMCPKIVILSSSGVACVPFGYPTDSPQPSSS